LRYAILADIHGNLTAFKAVLDDIEGRGGVDEIWCLGDIVGYGPEPVECIALLKELNHRCIAGNHDWAVVGKLELADFNPEAAAACLWTAQQLSLSEADYLKELPLSLRCDDFTLVHGSPREPLWEYLLSPQDARNNFSRFETGSCLIGHSHVPLIFEFLGEDGFCLQRPIGETFLKPDGHRLIINPGGVGQPRDGDPRASYAIYDGDGNTISHYRVPYDIEDTQGKMIERGLPHRLAARLSYGW